MVQHSSEARKFTGGLNQNDVGEQQNGKEKIKEADSSDKHLSHVGATVGLQPWAQEIGASESETNTVTKGEEKVEVTKRGGAPWLPHLTP